MEEEEYSQNIDNNNMLLSQLINQNTQNQVEINTDLMKRIEILDKENSELKEILVEFQEDLKEKESSLEESHKIISKLKDEYSKLIKDYQNIEQINRELIQESKYSKSILDNISKSTNNITKLQKQNEDLNTELIKQRNENNELKNKIQNMISVNNKNVDDVENKKIIISDLNGRMGNFVNMIKDREKIINEQSIKINDLNEIINKKDEEIKILVNFSKEINKENKQNVKEITKQAINTIKVLRRNNSFDSMNNYNYNQNKGTDNHLFIKNDKTSFSDFANILKKNKASFALNDALNSLLYIPDNIDNNIISKEFLMDMNFKTELLKNELFSSLLRESKIISFLKDILNKLNINDNNLIKDDKQNANDIFHLVLKMKNNLKNIIKENKTLRRTNLALKENLKQNNLLNEKIKNDVKKNMQKIKGRINKLSNTISNERNNYKSYNNNNSYNNYSNTNYMNYKNGQNYKDLENEIKNLKDENNRYKKNNTDLKEMINDYILSDNINKKREKNNKILSLDNKNHKDSYENLDYKKYNNSKDNNYINDFQNIKENNLNKTASNFYREKNLYNTINNNYPNRNFYSQNNNIDDKYINNFSNYHKKKNHNKNEESTYEYRKSPIYFSYNNREKY